MVTGAVLQRPKRSRPGERAQYRLSKILPQLVRLEINHRDAAQDIMVHSYTPTEEEVIKAINRLWRIRWNSFGTMGVAGIHLRIKDMNPTWSLSEKRLKDIRVRGLADGHLQQPREQIGRQLKPRKEEVQKRKENYYFEKQWREVGRARAAELSSTFEITTGELIFGQIEQMVSAMKTNRHDILSNSKENINAPGSTIHLVGWNFRAAAKPGTWNVVEVNPTPAITDEPNGYFMYHSSVTPMPTLRTAHKVSYGVEDPHILWVARYDWGYHGRADRDAVRTIADIDPQEWTDAWARKWEMYINSIYPDKFSPDNDKWDRIASFGNSAAFFIDALKALEVVKLLTRPSELDDRRERKLSSSLYSADSTEGAMAFGCHLHLDKWRCEFEVARLIYSGEKSALFPKDDELVGIWFDSRHWEYYDEEIEEDPMIIEL
ncbi:hypothetical protein EVG20_g10446 [Dentipellis fragilis]|uniref:Uncharacterized protein n=1 Tax=Dentipellis fragilis TaxID=205917 RepID=A0A4Y9XU71_9AGAM|nr:hypothetical protein EVG20_g10446 [Dentipellis fragilis]